MKNTPSFLNEYGKYIYGRLELEALTEAAFKGETLARVGDKKIEILYSERNEDIWIVNVRVDGVV